MSRPERRRPGAQSPLLIPQVEAVRTAPDAPTEAAPSTAAPQPIARSEERQPAPNPQTSRPAMIDRTFKIEEDLVRRSETAVLRRAGDYTSMRAFVNGAIAAELARLEETHNGGQPFPPNNSGFQRGRPFGS